VPDDPDTHPDRALTWAALLGRCTELARASAALPAEGEPGRWRDAVPSIVTLHSVTHALGELDELDDADRPVALDQAEILCREASTKLHGLWRGEPLPETLSELVGDSRVAFEMAANAGVEWLAREPVALESPDALVAGLLGDGFAGELFVLTPGVTVGAGAPVAFARAPGGAGPSEAHAKRIGRHLGKGAGEAERIATPRQVYRQLDFATGRATRDLVVPMHEDLPPGQPLLALVIEGGVATPSPMGARSSTEDHPPVESE